jgi:hypothetical protein
MKYIRFLIFPLWYLAMSCATQTTPQGGPRDTIPPSVVRYSPKENQANFKEKQITIEFDEAVVLNNPKEEIIIIPTTGKKTEFKLKGSTLVITPELPWRDSTTYNINFREAIKDLTEGNPAKDRRGGVEKEMHLAFSTGPVIDTLSISGSVKNGLDEKIPENITIALYKSDTFNIFDDVPEYFTKSNKEGKWSITNLASGKYKLYAFEDKNKNLKAETRTEKFGFLAKPIELDSIVKDLEIPMVNIDTRPPKLTSKRNQAYVNSIRFNKSMTDYQIISDQKIASSFASNQAEIVAFYPDIDIDSLVVQIKAIDSTEQIVDTVLYLKRDANKRIPEKFTASASEATYNLESNRLQFDLTFNKPIKAINPDSVYLTYDTVTVLPIKLKSLKLDTIHNKIQVNEVVYLDSLPRSPKVTIARSYLISVENDSSSQMTPGIRMIDAASTAILYLNIQTREPHFIIQLLNSGNKIIQQVVDQRKITFSYLPAEAVKIRAIIDTNANGVWDTAIYPQNREPEKIIYFLNSEKKFEVPLRANWEVGPLLFKF